MRLIIIATLFLIPLIGLASFPVMTTTPSDTIIESKKETMQEYNIRIKKQLNTTIEKTTQNTITRNKTKRKNFVIGGGLNFYSELENNFSVNIGSILFDYLYTGFDISNYSFIETRIYTPKINLYLSGNWGIQLLSTRSIDKYGIGYDYFIAKNISVSTEISFYLYERSWKTYSLNSSSSSFFGFDVSSTSHHVSHSGTTFLIRIQFHF